MHRRLPDRELGVPHWVPHRVDEGLDVHVENRRALLCHLAEQEDRGQAAEL